MLYPHPHSIEGKGERWLIEEMDEAIDQMTGKVSRIKDASARPLSAQPGVRESCLKAV
jgi:hypothetical protein